ncbi:hypothetical protein D3C75_1159450 [compost metagenome]
MSPRSMFKFFSVSMLCGSVRLISATPAISRIWLSPTTSIPTILPNICFRGETLVISTSITRELFSAVISVAMSWPVIITPINSTITRM